MEADGSEEYALYGAIPCLAPNIHFWARALTGM